MSIEVNQPLRRSGQEGGDQVDGITVWVEPGSIAACGKTQRPTPLGMARTGCGLADEATRHGASQGASGGGQEGPPGEARGHPFPRAIRALDPFRLKALIAFFPNYHALDGDNVRVIGKAGVRAANTAVRAAHAAYVRKHARRP